jgi:hypothetical protein
MHQTQVGAEVLKGRHQAIGNRHSLCAALFLEPQSLMPDPVACSLFYCCLPVSFCDAMEPAMPSLSESLILAHSARA